MNRNTYDPIFIKHSIFAWNIFVFINTYVYVYMFEYVQSTWACERGEQQKGMINDLLHLMIWEGKDVSGHNKGEGVGEANKVIGKIYGIKKNRMQQYDPVYDVYECVYVCVSLCTHT